ncbi:hypothetical protein D7316_00411 [Gordonia insulae]|uniref:Ig-like domain-containing protein n=2 Tax=Gordonia insulae TaxID=2420509 RepID=A0A3G8JHX9_9ACTN|nr:hypothetical protein D7316_00411 [Gordonia insulae]
MAVSKTRRTRILGAATAFIGVGAAGLVMAAPASADVSKVEITTPSGYGSTIGQYGTTCAYDVAATVDNYASSGAPQVTFTVSKDGGAFAPLGAAVDATSEVVTTEWTPTTPGTYKIRATQEGVSATTANLSVAQGFSPNSGSVELPLTDACIVLG